MKFAASDAQIIDAYKILDDINRNDEVSAELKIQSYRFINLIQLYKPDLIKDLPERALDDEARELASLLKSEERTELEDRLKEARQNPTLDEEKMEEVELLEKIINLPVERKNLKQLIKNILLETMSRDDDNRSYLKEIENYELEGDFLSAALLAVAYGNAKSAETHGEFRSFALSLDDVLRDAKKYCADEALQKQLELSSIINDSNIGSSRIYKSAESAIERMGEELKSKFPIPKTEISTRQSSRASSFFKPVYKPTSALDSMVQLSNGNIALGGRMASEKIRIINPTTGDLVKQISQFGDGVNCIIQLSNGNIAVGGQIASAQIRIINPTTGELVNEISQFGDGVNCIIQLSDGNIAVGGQMTSAQIRIINPTTGDLVTKIPQNESLTDPVQLQTIIDSLQINPTFK